MAIIFNGTTVDKVIFNGAEMETVKFDGVVVLESEPQLATPQNVTADGTNVSWDEVENATSYEVIEGGNNVLGTVTPSAGETWVLNETLTIAETATYNVNFTTNNESKTSFEIRYVRGEKELQYDGTLVYSNGNWTLEAYRTITFETAPTGDLLTWLQTNGVKQ